MGQIARYLEHYCNVSSFAARRARLTDLSLGSMSIGAAGKNFTIPLEPPMQSWREARERVIQMDRDCLAGLGRSDITVRQYTRPRGAHAVIFVVCALTYSPGFAAFVARVQPLVLALMIAIHVVEASIMARRLQRHNVAQLSGLWWQWVASSFIEGFGALQRVDALVQQGRREKDKQKH
ncbi:putative integral membrane [Diplodia seriata]|uniref:Putative integral membrane n=1 Tax=Diplodia seriata TaxID=420778 RepID=A0A0G2DSH9_9PEZI|nr:putative integral membrane [Diplodia seriata]